MASYILCYDVFGPSSYDGSWVIIENEMKGSVIHRNIMLDNFSTQEEAKVRADELQNAIQPEQVSNDD